MKTLLMITQRIIYAVILLLAVLVLNFTLMHLAPGDIADTIAGDMGGANAEVMAEIRRSYGLDQPIWKQLVSYLWNVAQLDLGYSYFFNTSVVSLLAERVSATLLLVVSAQILAIIIGVLLGVLAARRPNSLTSHAVTLLSLFSFSAPVFWTGIMLLISFSLLVPLFPVAGMQDATIEGGYFVKMVDVAHHLVLPTITLASIFLALYSRLCRASMLEVLGSDYIRTAHAKGLPERRVVFQHALRNAMSPVVTLAGLQFSAVVSGAVLVETVFSWPGLGTLALQSIIARDTPTILGILFFSSLVVVVANLLTDLALRLIDPRIRGGAK